MKAASLLLLVLCFPALLSPQQITPMNIAAPPGHPGQQLLMVSQRDLLLLQARAWQEGRELEVDAACKNAAWMKKDSCEEFRIHIEPENGSDSETILLHLYYRIDGTDGDQFRKLRADSDALFVKAGIGGQLNRRGISVRAPDMSAAAAR